MTYHKPLIGAKLPVTLNAQDRFLLLNKKVKIELE